ncbi:VOC family protein [Acetobacter conturbans]|uniref:VOC family protein n=1 Tax=Acetobacter conturbans TaxID=1737472 RepID=UPI001F54D369|nr:VOC family protein [Acetobacter conturbans]
MSSSSSSSGITPRFGSLHRVAIALLLGTSLAVAPHARAADTFLPISAPSTQSVLPGKIVYAQLTIPDLTQAKTFYGTLLGWTFKDIPVSRGRYAQAMAGGRNVAGFVEHPLPSDDEVRHQPLWLPFISATDPDAVVQTAKVWGGKILFKPHDIPGLGRETIIADPQGGVFAVIHSGSGDPVDSDTPTAQGEWIWSALLTDIPVNAAGFYQKLFGYEVQTSQDTSSPLRYLLESQGYARAIINPLPPRLPANAPARWMNFVQVDSVGATAEKVPQLGGKVLVEPHLDHNNCMIAIVADPAGAVFGIMEWHMPTVAGEAK